LIKFCCRTNWKHSLLLKTQFENSFFLLQQVGSEKFNNFIEIRFYKNAIISKIVHLQFSSYFANIYYNIWTSTTTSSFKPSWFLLRFKMATVFKMASKNWSILKKNMFSLLLLFFDYRPHKSHNSKWRRKFKIVANLQWAVTFFLLNIFSISFLHCVGVKKNLMR
jgi:hypothetical protein